VILTGETGRRKTHLAVAIAYRAIQNGFDVLFTTAAALVEELSVAARGGGRLAKMLPAYTRPSVLVVDELGYLTYGPDAANVLFHVVRWRARSFSTRWRHRLRCPSLRLVSSMGVP